MPDWKGKEKAVDDEWQEAPIVTYRHLLANVPNTHNPLRVVALADNDAFYAACERNRLGLGHDVPIVVQQWQSLIAVSYPAREFGITRMETVAEARRRCPNLVAVHTATYREGDSEPAYHSDPDPKNHKVSLDWYRAESKKIVELYLRLLPPGTEMERASIDEAFFDLTLPVRNILLTRFPHLAKVPPDAEFGLDTTLPPPDSQSVDWTGLGNLIPIKKSRPRRATPSSSGEESEAHKEDNQTIDEEHILTWCDVVLSIGAKIMQDVRRQIKDQLNYTTSCGVSRNKVLAKLVASYKKLDQQSILRNAAVPGYWRPMPFQKIRFLGGKLGDSIFNEFEVQTVGELEYLSPEDIRAKFGDESGWVWNILRGIDHSSVEERIAIKSMLSSKNIRPAITDPAEGESWIKVLAAELAHRLTEARDITPTLWPKTLVIHVRQDSEPVRSRQSPFPYTRNLSSSTISTLAFKLWKELNLPNVNLKDPSARKPKIYYIGLAFSGLSAAEAGQKSLEGWFSGGAPTSGNGDVIKIGGKRRRESDVDVDVPDETAKSWVCDKCRKTIVIAGSSLGTVADEDLEEERQRRITRSKMEHADWHFAKELALNGSEEAKRQTKKKKVIKNGQDKEKTGIAKYFGSAPSKGSTSKGRKP